MLAENLKFAFTPRMIVVVVVCFLEKATRLCGGNVNDDGYTSWAVLKLKGNTIALGFGLADPPP